MRWLRMIVLLAAAGAGFSSHGGELRLVVQTERTTTQASFAPLANYLSGELGKSVRIEVRRNPLAHWRALAAGERPAMVLEDPHFADYRISRAGYRVAAIVKGTQSFRIAVGDFLLLDPVELAGRPVATLSPPSLSTMQLLNFYRDPVRIPRLVEADSYKNAAARVFDASAVAAVLPAAALPDFPGLSDALALEELPEQALLVSPDVDEALFERIVVALLSADTESEDGRKALEAMGVSGFDRGHAEAYEGLSRLLEGTWGFRDAAP